MSDDRMKAILRQSSAFIPDYRHFESAMRNERPVRLPLYEHFVNTPVMEKVLGAAFSAFDDDTPFGVREFFRHYCRFYRELTYDVVSYEMCIGGFLPGGNAICGGMGPIQNRADFENYPWDRVAGDYWKYSGPRFDALVESMPAGMKAVGGVGNGAFELAESLVGLEYLPFIEVDDPELYTCLFNKIGDLMFAIWREFLKRYRTTFVACRFGDDLGFKSSLLTNPTTVRDHIFPQYKRVIDAVHAAGNRFLWHSCGNILSIMDDAIRLGIDGKHSNEDTIAPFSEWIERYGNRIALVGGFDLNFLCSNSPAEITAGVVEFGGKYRSMANGYALGSGNSIPEYVPVENYLAMIEGCNRIRERETVGSSVWTAD
jgi:uroporphyrinogen decarboxylase